MKKIFLSIAMIMCSIVAATAAANTAQFIAYVAEANDATSKDMSIYLENASYTPAFNNKGEDATKMARVASKPYVYSLVEDKVCGTTATNNLEGTFIVVCTTDATEYVFSFASVDGRKLYLKDHVTNILTPITSTDTYTFSATANRTLTGRFEIVVYTPGEFNVCVTYDQVELYDNQSPDDIVIINKASKKVITVAPTHAPKQVIDLSGEDAGHYILTVNGKQYEFCNKPVKN